MTLNDRFAWEALLRRIDDPQNESVVVIVVGPNRQVDTAGVGEATDPMQMFWLLHHVTGELADEIMPQLPEGQRPPIVLPTLEQAGDLGMLPFRRRRDS